MSLCQAPLIARVTGDALSTGIWGVVPRGPSLRAMDGLIWSLQVPRDKIGLDQRWTPGAPFPLTLPQTWRSSPAKKLGCEDRPHSTAGQWARSGSGDSQGTGTNSLTSPEAPPPVPALLLGRLGNCEWKC